MTTPKKYRWSVYGGTRSTGNPDNEGLCDTLDEAEDELQKRVDWDLYGDEAVQSFTGTNLIYYYPNQKTADEDETGTNAGLIEEPN